MTWTSPRVITDEPIRQAPLDESTIPFYPNLSWLHYERLLRVKDADARLWYLKEAAREQWDCSCSICQLLNP